MLPVLAEHQAFAVELFLRAVERIDQQVAERVGVGHGFEQLRVNARAAALVAGVLVGRAVLAGRVALGHLGGDELVVGPQRRVVIHGRGRLGAGLERGAPAAEGEAHEEMLRAAVGFEADVINFVGGSLAVVEGGLFGFVVVTVMSWCFRVEWLGWWLMGETPNSPRSRRAGGLWTWSDDRRAARPSVLRFELDRGSRLARLFAQAGSGRRSGCKLGADGVRGG